MPLQAEVKWAWIAPGNPSKTVQGTRVEQIPVALSCIVCAIQEWGMLWIALGPPRSRSWGSGWNRHWVTLSHVGSTVLGSRVWVEAQGSLWLEFTVEVLEQDSRILGPSKLVRRPDAETHCGGAHSLQTSGSLPLHCGSIVVFPRVFGWQAMFSGCPLPFIENCFLTCV